MGEREGREGRRGVVGRGGREEVREGEKRKEGVELGTGEGSMLR